MIFVVWLVIGAALGSLASLALRTTEARGVLINIAVGMVGALQGGWVVFPMVGFAMNSQNEFGAAGLLFSMAGSAILLAAINLFQHGTLRRSSPGGAI